jgi:hypothetical protein
MVEKLEETGRLYDFPGDEDSSGIRENPLLARLRALDARPGGLGGLVATVGVRVLARFERLTRDDHAVVVQAAIDRLSRLPPGAALGEARIAHAVLCEAAPVDMRRWAAEIGAPAAEITRELGFAARRAGALGGRERSVFAAVCALDAVADGDEVGKVVLRAAVVHQVRWNTAHQNVSRAWRKICDGNSLGSWCKDWRAGHRFVCGLPSFELWEAGRAYMDACSGKGDRDGEAFDAWVKAHEAHNAWFNEWKKQSTRAARRWREFALGLEDSGVRPADVHAPLVAGCSALGIDRWVVPAKLAQQSWRELLGATHRPSSSARGAWVAFLRDHGFGPAHEDAFHEVERDAALADVAGVELEHAYDRLLAAAEHQSGESRTARLTFRALVDPGDPR